MRMTRQRATLELLLPRSLQDARSAELDRPILQDSPLIEDLHANAHPGHSGAMMLISGP